MLDGQKILITGATGKIAFPIARALAERNEVWGAARMKNPADRDKLAAAGITPVCARHGQPRLLRICQTISATSSMRRSTPAPTTGPGASRRTHTTRASCLPLPRRQGLRVLLDRLDLRLPGQRPLRESDPPGVPLRPNYSFSKIAAEAVCTWVANTIGIPLTIIRICSTYGPEGGAPADRLDAMLAGKPIRLHPDKPNNYNPIYEDDYVELGIRAMEVADTPPIVVNWAGSETVSVEDYCAYMGELVGVEPIFEYTPDAHTPLWPDVTHMHEVLGVTKVPWREGFRRMIEARHPEIELPQQDSAMPGGRQ